MEKFKQCLECKSTDVPVDAVQCPFCGQVFKNLFINNSIEDEFYKEFIETKPEKTPEFILKESDKLKKIEPVEDNIQDKRNKVHGSKGNIVRTSTDYKAYEKKKKKYEFLKFFVVVIIIVFIGFKFIKSPMKEEYVQTRGVAEIYSADSISEELENQIANDEDEWKGEDEEFLEMSSEELLADKEGEKNQFILPLSNQVYLKKEDIEGLSAEELRLARNEIYARHGRIFKDKNLQDYFNNCEWYVGSISGKDFSDSVFNEYEMANKDLIVSYEHELGVNGQ